MDLLQRRQPGILEGRECWIVYFQNEAMRIRLFMPLCLSLLNQTFQGNEEAYETKKNTFFPPLVGRYIRLHPITWNNAATIRMEFYGCELDGKFGICLV